MREAHGPQGLPIWQVPVTEERQAEEPLAVRIPKDITLSSRVELFTNSVISPQMLLLLQLIKRTIKTETISQVHGPQSSSPHSDAALLPSGLAVLSHSENDRKELLNI